MSDVQASDAAVEELASVLHGVYQTEARRQAGVGDDEVRWPDDYDELPENTKEYDRVLARFILQRDFRLRSQPQWLLTGDLEWLEFAMADYIARWGTHLTGREYDGSTAGMPCAAANMAMTVIRKNIRRIEPGEKG